MEPDFPGLNGSQGMEEREPEPSGGLKKSSGPSAPPEIGAGDHVPAGVRAQDHDEGRLRH